MLECMRTHTNTYIIHAYHIHRYVHTCIYTCIHIHKVGPVRTGGWGFERQGRRKHACLAAYPVAISPSPYSGSSVFMFISCLCTFMHLLPCVLKKPLLFVSPRHACSAASSRLASGCIRVGAGAHAIGACTCVRIFLPTSLSLYPPVNTYKQSHTRTHTHT